jgi:hypothetical protein
MPLHWWRLRRKIQIMPGDDPWGDDAWANETRFARVSLGAGLSLQIRSTGPRGWIVGLLDLSSSFKSVDENQKGPRVVLVNKFAREHVIKQYTSVRKATGDPSQIKAETDEAGYWATSETVRQVEVGGAVTNVRAASTDQASIATAGP